MSRKPDMFLSEFKVKNKAFKVLTALIILAAMAGCQQRRQRHRSRKKTRRPQAIR